MANWATLKAAIAGIIKTNGNQEITGQLLQNVLNTRDFTQYSPAELLLRVGNAYAKAQHDYTQMIREYSYNHGDLGDLHL